MAALSRWAARRAVGDVGSWLGRAGPVLVGLVVLGGCGTAVEPVANTDDPAVTLGPAPSDEPDPGVTIAFAGNVNFDGRTTTRLDDPATAFGPISEVLTRADVAVVSLNTAVTDSTNAVADPAFRAPDTAFEALSAAGVDVAAMANDHVLDFGMPGFEDTIAAAETATFPVVGIGQSSLEAYAPWETTVNDHTVAVLAASHVEDDVLSNWTADPTSPGLASAYSVRLRNAVSAARDTADIVVVYLNWGDERQSCPGQEQMDLADSLISAGATAVVGGHAHRLQGAGWTTDGGFVGYGLGDFLWSRDDSPSHDTGILTLTVTDGAVTAADLAPAVITDGVPVPADADEADRIRTDWAGLRDCAELAGTPPS